MNGWGRWWTGALLLVLVAAILGDVSHEFMTMWVDPPIYPGPGGTDQGRLSDYFSGIEGTPADTDVYFLEGRVRGEQHYCSEERIRMSPRPR